MIPQDYTGFALESFVGKGEGLPMYYIQRDAIIELYHRYSGRYRMDWVFWDVLMGHKAVGWLDNVVSRNLVNIYKYCILTCR